MFEKTYSVLSPCFPNATLLDKFPNAHPEIAVLDDTYPSNAIEQTCRSDERVSHCPFLQAVKADTGTKRHEGPARLTRAISGAGE